MDKCPRCSGMFFKQNDGFEDYLLCGACAREFDMTLKPRRMTPIEAIIKFKFELPVETI